VTSHRDLLIGLNAGAAAIRAVAFDGRGREVAAAELPIPVTRREDGGAEQDLGLVWQRAAEVLRQLADQTPGLMRRTVGLAITGEAGGTWLIDEDGDPVGAARLSIDGRAATVIRGWRQSGIAGEVRCITGVAPTAASQSAQLAWLLRSRPELVAEASTALHGKDWLYFCCTGERATDPAEAIGTYGNLRCGDYDRRVLELTGLLELEALLPEVTDGLHRQCALGRAAAAASGLLPGTPVILTPVDPVATALASGLCWGQTEIGCTILGDAASHMRVADDREGEGELRSVLRLPTGELASIVSGGPGLAGLHWLVGACDQLLADAGLIGFPRAEFAELLERKAAGAPPRSCRFEPSGAIADGVGQGSPFSRASFRELSSGTNLYGATRAVYEALAMAARGGYEALGGRLSELRLAGEGCRSALCRALIAACVGAPVRRLHRCDPAAAGATLFAAVALGFCCGFDDALEVWVEPHLGEPEPLDPALAEIYGPQIDAAREPAPTT
jgi:erythritol kinase